MRGRVLVVVPSGCGFAVGEPGSVVYGWVIDDEEVARAGLVEDVEVFGVGFHVAGYEGGNVLAVVAGEDVVDAEEGDEEG